MLLFFFFEDQFLNMINNFTIILKIEKLKKKHIQKKCSMALTNEYKDQNCICVEVVANRSRKIITVVFSLLTQS